MTFARVVRAVVKMISNKALTRILGCGVAKRDHLELFGEIDQPLEEEP